MKKQAQHLSKITPEPDTNIHCYYEVVEHGQVRGECPEFCVIAFGADRDGCESAIVKLVHKKDRENRCYTHHANGELPPGREPSVHAPAYDDAKDPLVCHVCGYPKFSGDCDHGASARDIRASSFVELKAEQP